MEPKVTVVITTLDRLTYLQEAVAIVTTRIDSAALRSRCMHSFGAKITRVAVEC